MKIAIAFARGPDHLNTRHHCLSPHSQSVVLRPLVEPEPEFDPESDPEPGYERDRERVLALVAVHGTVIV